MLCFPIVGITLRITFNAYKEPNIMPSVSCRVLYLHFEVAKNSMNKMNNFPWHPGR